MPNVGRPSRDCHACRRQRLKCDLTHPECYRCLRKGQLCPGYRDDLEIRFRSETVSSFPSNMSRDRRRTHNREGGASAIVESQTLRVVTGHPGIKGTRDLPAEINPNHTALFLAGTTSNTDLAPQWTDAVEQADRCLLSSERRSPLRYPLAESWNDHFVPLTMDKINISFDMAKNAFNTFPHVISKAEEGSALYQACSAVGCAYMASINRYPKANSNRVRAYGTALTAVNSALRDPQQCKSNSTLMSVWLLGLYEFLLSMRESSNSLVMSPGWDVHSQGLTALIRLRGPENFVTQDGRNLFWIVFNSLQIQSQRTGQECPKESFTWIHKIYQHCEPPEYPLLRTGIFSYHCTLLCSRVRRLVDAGNPDELLSSSASILQEMEAVEKVTHPLSNEKPITDCVVEPPLTQSAILDHVDPYYKGMYIYRSTFRMRVSYHVLEFLLHASRAPSCTPQQRTMFTQFRHRCIEELQALAKRASFLLGMTPNIGSLPLLDLHIRTCLLPRTGPIDDLQSILVEN